MKNFLLLAVSVLQIAAVQAPAQTLSVEDLRAQIDDRVNAMNPYSELLNDPDPARSIAAMEIMLESGDSTLRRMALEFGLLSPNPQVRRAAFEAYLATGPNLTVQIDGTEAKDDDYRRSVERLGGTVGANGAGYFILPVGSFNSENKCFVSRGFDRCIISSNGDGAFLAFGIDSYRRSGRGVLKDDGTIQGSLSLFNISVPLPFTIKLIE